MEQIELLFTDLPDASRDDGTAYDPADVGELDRDGPRAVIERVRRRGSIRGIKIA